MTTKKELDRKMDALKYKKETPHEHVLNHPEMYIGPIESEEDLFWIYDSEKGKMVYKTISVNQGLLKIVDEILVNARDEHIRSESAVKHISVEVGKIEDTYQISIMNDGKGIPIVEHPTEKMYVPQMIFGNLLTSSNYDKKEEKFTGGTFGIGSKATNIFSKKFTVDIVDPVNAKHYLQTWTNNMTVCGKPTIKKSTSKTGSVKITFEPDMAKFLGSEPFLQDGMEDLIKTRVYEIAALLGKDVKTLLNGTHIKSNTFEKFVNLFVQDGTQIAYEQCGERWEAAAVLKRSLYDEESLTDQRHVSFVNGIHTRKGGKHVETVVKHVLGDFCEYAKKKKVDVKPGQIKDSVVLFINSQIVNPSFDSQTKETLTTPASKFGSLFKTKGKIVDGLVRAGLLDEAQSILDAKLHKDAKKTDGKKKTTIRGLPKLEDALRAGGPESYKCTLILTEGDSAATSAITGLKVVGREYWGVFPLRGKLLNVKDISLVKFNQNEELTNIKKIIGLEQGKKYADVKQLRYGRVMIMADQDHDGSHIKGLLMNLFHTEWPQLLKTAFLCSLATPLLKATKRNVTKSFYSQGDFETWKSGEGASGWTIKYYKGLGTSTPAEAREWFEQMHEIGYEWDEKADENIHLAFNKKRADDRKKWLSTYDSKKVLDLCVGSQKSVQIPYSLFINNELIHFSNADNLRSLPHLMDGLKPSQRKILYGCLKRNLRSEVKVAQLAGYISEHTSYHHGETSLNETIIGMAQTFVGANNINLLVPEGQFGSRLMGGKDSASPRYIHTHLERIVDTLFKSADSKILKYIEEDGSTIEPETYYPVVPLLIINGSLGIGTGFSTNIPSHNPQDVISVIRDRLTGSRESLAGVVLNPWWLGFRGTIERTTDNGWVTKGLYEFNDEALTITVTELPIGTWTKEYKELLDKLSTVEAPEKKIKDAKDGKDGKDSVSSAGKKRPLLKGFDDLYNDVDVKFILYFDEDVYHEYRHKPEDFVKKFGLSSSIRTSNMVCFSSANDADDAMSITKFLTVGDMMEAYYVKRIDMYEQRKANEITVLTAKIRELDAKMRFIKGVLDEDIVIARASDEEILEALKSEDIPALDNEDEPDNLKSYEYVLKLRIDRLKQSSVDDLESELETLAEDLEHIEGMKATELWLEDLAVFEKEWVRMLADKEAILLAGAGTLKQVKKKISKKKS